MTQIDSTAQTDLGISDHEELLLPYKAIYSQLLDTIREVVTQTLDNAYGSGAPRITTEVLEIALKDNLSSLVSSPEKKTTHHQVVKKTERVGGEANVDPKLLKMLQNNCGVPQQPDIFNQTTNQLLKLIELNNLNSELNKSQNKLQQFSPYLGYPNLHKVNPYSSLLSQQNSIFKSRETNVATPFNPVARPFTPPILPTLQKPYHSPPETTSVAPKIFTPGVIKIETNTRVSPARSPQQAFSATEGTNIFSQSSPFTSVNGAVNMTSSSPVSSSATLLNSSPSPQRISPHNLTSSNHNLITPNHHHHLSSTLQQQSLLTTTSHSTTTSPLLTPSPLNHSHYEGGLSKLLNNGGAALLNNSVPTPGGVRNNMEVHQNFIKQINLLNQTAPSMLGQKISNIPGQEKSAGDIEKVLMDIQVNLTNIKPDPWGAAKDKLYKCPHCETAFARRQYLSNHIINVHNLKTCPECKTTFSNEDAFNAHLALHPKKEYECGSCNKSFNSVYLLKNHRKTHVKDKPFACNICGKTFADKYYLRNHFSIHSPVKPYSCPVCGRGFASSSALRYHSFQHTGEKPAKCQYCPSEFVQKNQLKLHIARKHKELISSLNPLHEGDIIPGNMSLGSSPSGSPAHCSPKHNNSIVHSPTDKTRIFKRLPTPPVPQEKKVEAMQVDSVETSPKEKVETKVESPTVALATEQLQELIASLQRTSKSTTTTVKTEKSPNNFKISSPFSKITDGINQLLEGSSVVEAAPLETS